MKNMEVFVSENFQFLEVTFSMYLNRSVFVMVDVRPFYGRVKFASPCICMAPYIYMGKMLRL